MAGRSVIGKRQAGRQRDVRYPPAMLAYISQLMANDDFRAAVTELRVKNLTAATERDGKIDGLEDRALGKMEEMIDWITKPTDMARVFMTLNTAKRRGTAPKDNLIINNLL